MSDNICVISKAGSHSDTCSVFLAPPFPVDTCVAWNSMAGAGDEVTGTGMVQTTLIVPAGAVGGSSTGSCSYLQAPFRR